MHLDTRPHTPTAQQSEDWLLNGQVIGTLTAPPTTGGPWVANISVDALEHGLFASVSGMGPNREAAAAEALRRMSMASLAISRRYTEIVGAIQ